MANKRKKNKSLTRKVEDLENQAFGQRLLIDELESKLETLEKKVQKVLEPEYTFSPYVPAPIIPLPQSQPPLTITVTGNSTLPPCALNGHTWGTGGCVICGQLHSDNWYTGGSGNQI